MNREYYINKLENLQEIEKYNKTIEQNLLCKELKAFLNNELTQDIDIIKEISNNTKKGKLLKSILNDKDLAIIKAYEDIEDMPKSLRPIIIKSIKKIDRARIDQELNKKIIERKRPAVIVAIKKLKDNEFLEEEDIEEIFKSVTADPNFETRDIEAILLLIDGINKGIKKAPSKEKKYHNGLPENDKEMQEEIKSKLSRLFEKYNFTWEIYPDGDKWYVLTSNDDIFNKVKKHYYNTKNKKEFIKVDRINNLKCRYEEYLNYIVRYGNIDNIEKILEYLDKKGLLSSMCFNGEIIAKTLVLSSVDEIDNLINVIKEHTEGKLENYALDIITKAPTLLFKSSPSLGSRNVNTSKKPRSGTSLSGSLTTFMESIKLLDENGIKIDLSKKGLSLVNNSTQKIKRNIDTFKLYGISLEDNNVVTAIVSTNPGKLIDLAIESDAFDYIKENLTRTINANFSNSSIKYGTIPSSMLPYILKYYKEKIDSDNYKDLWNTPKKQLKVSKILESCHFNSLEEIFLSYGKVKIKLDSNLEETFDKIINLEDNTKLYNFDDDPYIEAFDKAFKCDDNEYAYKFDGVIISRYKFLRNYNSIINKYYLENIDKIRMVYDEQDIKKEILLYCLTKDSMLNGEEVNKIVKSISKFETSIEKGKHI